MNTSRDLLAELTVNRPVRRRGIERYNLLLDATETLLAQSGDEDISLAQIAEAADKCSVEAEPDPNPETPSESQ